MSMRSVYRKIGRKHGVSVGKVKKEMEKAVKEAYNNPTAAVRAYQDRCDKKGHVPTVDEFIKYAAKEVNGQE